MRNYEAVFVFSPDDDKFKAGLEFVREELKKVNAQVTKEEDMGLKELTYIVKKETQGHYFCFYAQIDPESVITIDKAAKLQKNVLKYLFVRKDD